MFFVSEKKKYSRISRIFKFAFFSSQSRILHLYGFHALLHNGLLSIDATLQALILLLKFSLITRQLNQSIMTVILLTCIFNSMQKIPETHSIGETGGNSRCSFDNHTHSLPFHFNADDLNINDLNVCILKSNFKDNKQKINGIEIIISF